MSDAVARLNAALAGHYTIEREIGEGGMAVVYLADDVKHERKGPAQYDVGESMRVGVGGANSGSSIVVRTSFLPSVP